MARSPFSEEMESLRRQLFELQTLVLEPPPLDAAPTGPAAEQPLPVPESDGALAFPAGEKLARQLMNACLDGIAILGPDLTITGWSPSMERIFGVSEDAALGRSVLEVLPFLTESGDELNPARVFEGRTLVSKERRFALAETGKQGHFEGHYSPIADDAGRLVACLAIFRETTERRRCEEARRATEEKYRELFENPTDMVFTHDLEGRLTSINKAAERITGYSVDEALRMKFTDLVAPDFLPSARDIIRRQIAGDSPATFELDIIAKSGHRVALEISTRPIFRNGLPFAIQGLARDITERKKTEEALHLANQKLEAWVNELEQRTHEMTLLSEMGDMLRACLNTDEAYNVIIRIAQQIFPVQVGALYVITPSRNLVEAAALWGNPSLVERIFSPEECWGLRRGRVHWVEDANTGLLCKHLHQPPPNSYLCVPMMAQSEALGVLHLTQPEGAPITEAKQRLAVTMAEHIAMALSNLKLHETLRSQSIRDPLTGLFNRRFMEESLELELRRAARNQKPLGVIMVDVDRFNQINDGMGRDAGDAVLRDVGGLLQSTIRKEDIACRISGQKFAVILPNGTVDITLQRAENLRQIIRNFEVKHRRQAIGSVTVSAGVAAFPDHGRIGEALLRAADGALSRAMQDGGDRVTVAT
jgi:diguanylate cyclase (GGDEF)-like protein/PAS domain S-box-containing protein